MSGLDATYYEDLQGKLRALLILTAHWMAEDQRSLVNELIDANECGVALEMMTDLLVAAEAPIGEDAHQTAIQLARIMECDASVLKDGINSLAENVRTEVRRVIRVSGQGFRY